MSPKTSKTMKAKRGRGRPPKAPEDKAAVTIHVRFTASEIEKLDDYLSEQQERSQVGAVVTRSSFVRAVVLGVVDAPGAPKKRGRR
jgi:hypothetical protein